MRKFVMADIHGAHLAMLQCFERCGFDHQNDLLVQTGDVVDGYGQVYECVEELMGIKNLIAIKGNHDDWFREFIDTEYHPYFWNHGGRGTLDSYLKHAGKEGMFFQRGNGYKSALVPTDIPASHRAFFTSQLTHFIDKENRCFVHGGFNRALPFDQQDAEEFYWDRSLWKEALAHADSGLELTCKTKFAEIFIGHTPTQNWNTDQPMKAFNIFNLDTGTSHEGRLTIMDIDTKEYWQSDLVTELYSSVGIRSDD
ncbi:metallophosphoesterase [Pedobacter chitinilyticus]|uniref:Phosphoesterase n=1 Tax=Pedobacter chitinilyticus TaxID=2233776 RepID=A0A443YW16_9SPHI|nr:metallophosphoesterase [Pedobacter chitinilyticus]RWU08192.1 phosphoesterase [Pedobacter chitinilyticus]